MLLARSPPVSPSWITGGPVRAGAGAGAGAWAGANLKGFLNRVMEFLNFCGIPKNPRRSKVWATCFSGSHCINNKN